MELIILGSGTGVIQKERGSPGFLLKDGNKIFLIDSGPGTLTRILKAGYSILDIDALFYTHIHPDHISDLAPFLFACKYSLPHRKKKLTIVGGPGFKKFFDDLSRTYRGWLNPKSFMLEILEVKDKILKFGNVRILGCPANHIHESVAFRFEKGSKSIVLSGDTDESDDLARFARRANLFLLECSFPDVLKVKGHLTPTGAGKLLGESMPEKGVLIHFYPPCDKINILKEVKRIYHGKVVLGRDGMVIKI